MTLLFRIIYAAHANGTHHKLALDALRTLENERAETWRRLFLANAELYMEGAKAPDKQFKDFKNHVLHVRDDYWGGAPEKAASWYALLVRALRERNWTEAVWCAGILSHYYTDPIHPFHTAQSEAESNIHRAVEWSISKSYDALRARGLKAEPLPLDEPSHDAHWLKDMVIAGAETSNRYYETLIANYDFSRGVVEPPEGLDGICRDCIGKLVVYAATGFGRILDRAFEEAAVEPPEVTLTAQTVIASLKIPAKWVTRKLADAQDRRLVEQMYDELQETGRVEKSLTEDDRTIRELHAKEVAPVRDDRRRRDRSRRRESVPQPEGRLAHLKTAEAKPVRPIPVRTPQSEKAQPLVDRVAEPIGTLEPPPDATEQRVNIKFEEVAPASGTDAESKPLPITSVPSISPASERKSSRPVTQEEADSDERTLRIYLAAEDDVEAAPSIGPRTASRLYDIGIHTIADLLSVDPEDVADRLAVRHITPEVIADWQDQSRLVMDIPGLRGTHAQLLVGVGLRSADQVAGADPATTQAAILRFAGTREGQRLLRDAAPPDLERITTWLESARTARAA